MSILGKNILRTVRQPGLISSLANSIRGLSITPISLHKRTGPVQVLPKTTSYPKKDLEISADEQAKCQDIFNKVNQQLAKGEEGRLFAVVQLAGKQFKITSGDIILIEGYWPPNAGDEIRLEKVLLAGAKDFTLIGSPILDAGLVDIKATIIEKTLTHTKTHFKKKRRKQYLRINFQRSPNTMIRINSIEISKNIDTSQSGTNEIRLF